jgi:hypothetical protein
MKICTTPGEVNHEHIRKEIPSPSTKRFKALLNGDRIAGDEVVLIRQCASELLEKVKGPSETSTGAPAKIRRTARRLRQVKGLGTE